LPDASGLVHVGLAGAAWTGLAVDGVANAGCCVDCAAGGSLGGGVAGVVACAANRANQSTKR